MIYGDSMKQGVSRADAQKKIRQQALREFLSQRNKADYILDSITKLEDLTQILERDEIQRLKIAIDSRLKLLNKYLPDAKIELETSDGRTVNPVEMLINFVPDLRTNEEIINND